MLHVCKVQHVVGKNSTLVTCTEEGYFKTYNASDHFNESIMGNRPLKKKAGLIPII